MESKRIYLAAPYSHPDASVREQRFMAVSERANATMRLGHLVYSPITHGHILGLYGGLPGDFEFWERHCLSFLRRWAEELWVMSLPGWETSRGVLAEMEEAGRLDLPVRNLL